MTSGIPVNSTVLRWARESMGYTIDDLKADFPQLASWEAEESYPSYGRLEALARKYKRPVAIFFFPNPPEEEKIEKSLRALSEDSATQLTPKIRYLFRKAKAFQLNLKELGGGYDGETPDLGWLRSLPKQNMKELAKEVRNRLGVSIETQKEWKNSDEALREWRNILGKKGIYVWGWHRC